MGKEKVVMTETWGGSTIREYKIKGCDRGSSKFKTAARKGEQERVSERASSGSGCQSEEGAGESSFYVGCEKVCVAMVSF